jgi:hypothetical protein
MAFKFGRRNCSSACSIGEERRGGDAVAAGKRQVIKLLEGKDQREVKNWSCG